MNGNELLSALLGITGALLFVLALAFAVIWLLRQMQDRRLKRAGKAGSTSASDRSLRFVRALPLGPRERAALVECAGETFLLGVAAGSVTVLARWPELPPNASVAVDRGPEADPMKIVARR